MTKKIEQVKQKIVYQMKRSSIREDTVVYGDGQVEIHEMLQVPEGVLILPVTQQGTIILTKEYRYNHGWIYGVPMGRREINDSQPLESAKRELQEEIGLSAKKWTLISTHHNGIHEEGLNYFFLAEGLSHGENKLDADENIEKAEMTFEDAFKLMDEGKIVELRSRGCIWAGYIHLQLRNKKDSNNAQSL